VKVRFLADASLRQAIVSGLVRLEPAVDFTSAISARLAGVDDPEVLAVAAREERILVTHDLKSMPRHFARFLEHSQSPGVILISQKTAVADAIESLLLVWLATEPADWVNRICRLPL